jgi:hypothetical protein
VRSAGHNKQARLNMDGDDLRVKAASAVADAIKLDTAGKSEAAASSYDIASSALQELLSSGFVTDADRDSIERVRKAWMWPQAPLLMSRKCTLVV